MTAIVAEYRLHEYENLADIIKPAIAVWLTEHHASVA